MKDLLKNKSTLDGRKALTTKSIWKMGKKCFHKPENPFPLTGVQDCFENTFALDGKIKLAMAGVSKTGRKNGSH